MTHSETSTTSRCPDSPLSESELQERLATLPSWTIQENALERVVKTNTYMAALDILNAVAHLSETADHHPDLLLGWCTLTIRYWTHTAQGITERDFQLAQQVETLLSP